MRSEDLCGKCARRSSSEGAMSVFLYVFRKRIENKQA
jgi:hypothetical protein